MDIFSRRIHMCVSETLETCLHNLGDLWTMGMAPQSAVSHWPHLTHFIVNVLSAVRISCLVTNRLDQILSHSEPTLGGAVVESLWYLPWLLSSFPFPSLGTCFQETVSHRPWRHSLLRRDGCCSLIRKPQHAYVSSARLNHQLMSDTVAVTLVNALPTITHTDLHTVTYIKAVLSPKMIQSPHYLHCGSCLYWAANLNRYKNCRSTNFLVSVFRLWHARFDTYWICNSELFNTFVY